MLEPRTAPIARFPKRTGTGIPVKSPDLPARMNGKWTVRYDVYCIFVTMSTIFFLAIDNSVKECYLFIMKQNERTLREWYVETSEEFWSGQWEGSDSAFVFAGVALFLMFFIPFNWTDIVYYVSFIRDVLVQPVYGGCALIFIIRMVKNGNEGRVRRAEKARATAAAERNNVEV